MKIIGLTKKESERYIDLRETNLDNCTKKMIKGILKLINKVIKALDKRAGND